MNETIFPLPDLEQHKLDEVKEEILHPVSRRLRQAWENNAWTVVAISVAAGVACGLMWGRRG